jgi:hypothetical protein
LALCFIFRSSESQLSTVSEKTNARGDETGIMVLNRYKAKPSPAFRAENNITAKEAPLDRSGTVWPPRYGLHFLQGEYPWLIN